MNKENEGNLHDPEYNIKGIGLAGPSSLEKPKEDVKPITPYGADVKADPEGGIVINTQHAVKPYGSN